MNEKIKELYEECTSHVYVKTDGYGNDNFSEELEKFAELIIKECVIVCKTGGVSNSDYNTGRLHCVYDIKQHFGLE
jgi:hypothetical protein